MLIPASFVINSFGLEARGLFKPINDIQGTQLVVGPYGLMTYGLAFRVDEQWAIGFSSVSTAWTNSFSLPSTSWTLAFSLPTTTWTPQSF